jgi:UPF0755 protein
MINLFKKKRDENAPFQPIEGVKAPAAPREKKMKTSTSLYVDGGNAFFTFVLVALMMALLLVTTGRSRFYEPGPLEAEKIVYIPKGVNLDAISTILENSGAISSATVFQANAYPSRLNFKFGEYKIPKNASMDQITKILIEGKGITHSLTLPEGLTSEQIIMRIYENDILTGDLTQIPAEGSLLPNTYQFQRGTTRAQMVLLLRAEQKKHLDRIWAARAPHTIVKTPEDLVILASIVEKETGKAEERARVAGVFSNRIRTGMRLQSDPTIIYGLVGGKGSLGRGLLRSEIDKLTPYNTYQINGLPPTPIANPGIAAMEAVANPAKTRDVFFVADGTGGHVFAETLEQHNRNVVKWRQIEKERAQ